MDIQQVWQQWMPLVSTQTAAAVDLEIREELQFHLDMRTLDNVRAGMSPEEARRDARQRFGDFEASRRECRQITLGPQLLLRRLQTGMIVVLISAVIYLGVLLFRLQTSSRDQIEALTQMVRQLQVAGEPVRDAAAIIPYVQWNRGLPRKVATEGEDAEAAEAAEILGWNSTDNLLQQPWSNWQPLDGAAQPF